MSGTFWQTELHLVNDQRKMLAQLPQKFAFTPVESFHPNAGDDRYTKDLAFSLQQPEHQRLHHNFLVITVTVHSITYCCCLPLSELNALLP